MACDLIFTMSFAPYIELYPIFDRVRKLNIYTYTCKDLSDNFET